MAPARAALCLLVVVVPAACSTTTPPDGGVDAGDSGAIDAGEAGAIDAGDAGSHDAGDAGTQDAGDSGAQDAGDSGAQDAGTDATVHFTVEYTDTCPCATPPCCPHTTFSYTADPGLAAWFLQCGDLVACTPPPVGWERMNASGGWDRVVSPGPSGTSGFACVPGMLTDPWIDSVPMPPSGTVRAIGMFDLECGATPGTCTTRCGAPFEVTSNAIVVP